MSPNKPFKCFISETSFKTNLDLPYLTSNFSNDGMATFGIKSSISYFSNSYRVNKRLEEKKAPITDYLS